MIDPMHSHWITMGNGTYKLSNDLWSSVGAKASVTSSVLGSLWVPCNVSSGSLNNGSRNDEVRILRDRRLNGSP